MGDDNVSHVVHAWGEHRSRHYELRETSYQLGGEGEIYSAGNGLLAKVYRNLDPEEMGWREEKLSFMTRNTPSFIGGRKRVSVAWPLDILYIEGSFAGFVMAEFANAKDLKKLHAAYRKIETACNVIPNYNWETAVIVAANLADAVSILHEEGVVVGDLNARNLLVNPDGQVSLIDVDSFDIRRIPGSNALYRCTVAVPEYRAPELQIVDLREKNEEGCTVHTDEFALAVQIFQLLSGGHHPFRAGKVIQDGDSDAASSREDNMKTGRCPYFGCSSDCSIPFRAPDLGKILPSYIVEDFRATFKYKLDPGQDGYLRSCRVLAERRTSASRWHEDLLRLREEVSEGGFSRCEAHPFHMYPLSQGMCEFCTAEKSKRSMHDADRREAEKTGFSVESESKPEVERGIELRKAEFAKCEQRLQKAYSALEKANEGIRESGEALNRCRRILNAFFDKDNKGRYSGTLRELNSSQAKLAAELRRVSRSRKRPDAKAVEKCGLALAQNKDGWLVIRREGKVKTAMGQYADMVHPIADKVELHQSETSSLEARMEITLEIEQGTWQYKAKKVLLYLLAAAIIICPILYVIANIS